MYFSIFLRHGLLFPQRNDYTLFLFVRCLHFNDKTVRSAALRIARQLLAIGVFHIPTTYSNPELKWPRSDHHYYDIVDVNCMICAENRRLRDCITCPRVASAGLRVLYERLKYSTSSSAGHSHCFSWVALRSAASSECGSSSDECISCHCRDCYSTTCGAPTKCSHTRTLLKILLLEIPRNSAALLLMINF